VISPSYSPKSIPSFPALAFLIEPFINQALISHLISYFLKISKKSSGSKLKSLIASFFTKYINSFLVSPFFPLKSNSLIFSSTSSFAHSDTLFSALINSFASINDAGILVKAFESNRINISSLFY